MIIVILLIDEPYKYTIKIESSKIVWNFSIEIAKDLYIIQLY